MIHNDILRRLRYALSIDDASLLKLFARAGITPGPGELEGWMARQDEEHFVELEDAAFEGFLDSLILARRGPPPEGSTPPPPVRLNNNQIVKKLRIALTLSSADVVELVRLGGKELSSAELGGLMRPPGHKHYRECGDQLLRAFLRGLTLQRRG